MHFLRQRRRSLMAYHRGPLPAFFIIVALFGVSLSPLATPALTAQDGTDTTECEAGLILDENLGECVPEEPPAQVCNDGEMLDPGSGECVPEVPPEQTCAEGEVLEASGQCVPDEQNPPTCTDGEILDPNTSECVIPPKTDPPAEQKNTCAEGEAIDPDSGQCVKVENTPQDCVEGEIYNPTIESCQKEAQINLIQYTCPPGFKASTVGEAELLSNCPSDSNREDGAVLTHLGPLGQATRHSGGLSLYSLVPGRHTISEQQRDTFGVPVVLCDTGTFPQDTVVEYTRQLTSMDGSIAVDIPAGGWLSCEWFSVPLESDGGDFNFTVYKYICPEDAPPENTWESYSATCTETADGIEFTLDNADGSSTKTTVDGFVRWRDAPTGPFTLTETIPPGYGEPIWWCESAGYYPNDENLTADGIARVDAPGGVLSDSIDYEFTLYYVCAIFNVVDKTAPVFVEKYVCPEGVTPEETLDWYQAQCTLRGVGIEFTLDTDLVSPAQITNATGVIEWHHVPAGPFTLTETVPPGYEPVWWCASESASEVEPPRYGESIEVMNRNATEEYYCHVFNVAEGPGELTIQKWRCPEGYDVTALGADPTIDCTEAMDGVTFTLDQPADVDLQSNTGDSVPGAVYFGGLPPGSYVVTESVPDGIASAFVWDCVGTDIDAVHPTPLSTGNVLNIDVAGGDSIVCNWYNVPAPDPDVGQLTIYKYICAGSDFVSELDCEIYEHGAEFTVFGHFGDTVSDHSGVSGATGQLTWTDLAPGPYEVLERDDAWCHIVSDGVAGDNTVDVTAGAETVVTVYNCGQDPTTTGKPPMKYPNTGMAQNDDADDAGNETSAADEPGATTLPQGTPGAGACPRLALAVGTPAAATPGTTDETTTAEAQPPSTPDATPGTCERGAQPVEIDIEAANVDATIEVVEVVNGVMEPPSGPAVVSWYKETARPGEAGNIVMAGHLNYWNVPEGVFFSIDALEEGDRIEITGDDGELYTYEVQWVQRVDASEPPTAAMVGPTLDESLTLITCGGEWNAQVSEYDQRTVVRAVRVQVTEAST